MNFNDYTLVELRQLAKENGIKNVSKLKKEELVSLLEASNNEDSNKKSINERIVVDAEVMKKVTI